MKITIDIPEDKKEDLIDAFAVQYKYQEIVENPEFDPEVEGSLQTIPNPVSKGAFARNILKSFVKEVYVAAQTAPLQDQAKTIVETANTEMADLEVT